MARRKRIAESELDRAVLSNQAVMEALSYVLMEVAQVLDEHSSDETCCRGRGQCGVVAGLAPLAERADKIISSRLDAYDASVR